MLLSVRVEGLLGSVAENIKQLWHRRVVQYGAIYLGVAWLLLQVAIAIENTLDLPDWVDRMTLVVLLLGFPPVLLLAWMQERRESVFVAATSNRIELLPAELLRRGRFDEIFFVDLPKESERKAIFEVHLRKHGKDPGQYDLIMLGKSTKGWNGAEIEQAVIWGMIEAFNEKRSLAQEDLFKVVNRTIPLSTTMQEQMKALRSWAHNRALNASKG